MAEIINGKQYKILFASSEIYPLIKTGGLADVAQSLPRALKSLGQDIRLVMPAYRDLKIQLQHVKSIAQITLLEHEVEILKSILPGTNLHIWLIDCPALFDRKGNPYIATNGSPWVDNAQRFAIFGRAIAALASNNVGINWQPDIVHCNDWQTALAPALLHYEKSRPGTVFTIHNLAYQGVFPRSTYLELQLPDDLWSYESMEFYGQFSFIKGGIVYADQVTTVSPTYAAEIQTKEYGSGLESLLKFHSEKLTGIINGINLDEWNPNKDAYINSPYSRKTLKCKTKNKLALQKELKIKIDENIPLLATVSRLVPQKGIDLIVEVLPNLKSFNVQVVFLGSGDIRLQEELTNIAAANPEQVIVKIGYDEALAHKITAAADFFVMPSRFEPCGLNQMYSQHYGTVPIVRKTGGLADTVIDNSNNSVNEAQNTGIVFEQDNSDDLLKAIIRGLDLFSNKKLWKQIQLNAMCQDFSWKKSALQYTDLYTQVLNSKNKELSQ